jgi:iron complex transport system substrate-binding protein
LAFGEQRLLVAILAVLIALSILGYASLYVQVGRLAGEVERTADAVEGLERTLSEVSERVASLERGAARAEDLEALAGEVEALAERLEEVSGEAVKPEDLERLAAELAELSARLEELSRSLESAGEAAQGALMAVEELRARVEELQRTVDSLAESILFPVEIVDGSGDVVVIPERPERIVSLAPSVTETLYYVGALDRLVGVDDYSDWPRWVAEARERGEIASVGGFWSPSVEAILALEPDLVVGVASAPPHFQVKEILESYGIPVLLLPNETLRDVKESMIMLGKATGNVSQAYEAAILFEAAVSAASGILGDAGGVRVAVIVWLEPLFVVGWGNWEHDIITSLGAVNVYGDEENEALKGWPVVSVESLLERAPEVIVILGAHTAPSPEDFVDWLESQLGSAAYEIPAVAEGRVYVIAGLYADVFARPSPRTALAVYVMAAVVAPETLGLSPEEVPGVVSPETLDVLGLLRDVLPERVYAFLGEALG